MSPSIRVAVLDDAKAKKCEGHCGLDFSSPEAVEEVAKLLNKLYGEKVQLEYLDLAEPSTSRSYPEIVERIRTEHLALPLLLINGNLRISGYFDIYLLQSAIQVELEMAWM
jgi:disulfide oxidoreductase YuzD